jgi:hypothetical protein
MQFGDKTTKSKITFGKKDNGNGKYVIPDQWRDYLHLLRKQLGKRNKKWKKWKLKIKVNKKKTNKKT